MSVSKVSSKHINKGLYTADMRDNRHAPDTWLVCAHMLCTQAVSSDDGHSNLHHCISMSCLALLEVKHANDCLWKSCRLPRENKITSQNVRTVAEGQGCHFPAVYTA